MNYDLVADRIEVRATKVGDIPRYVVRATAMVANKKDIYEYAKKADGSIRTLKSMFTPHCIESIKEQSKHKKLFVDSQHELALNTNIKSMLKGKLSPEEEKRIDAMLKTKMLPLAKLNDIDIEENNLNVDTELNPMFREVDLDHQKYFDAVWYSLQNKFLNGVSVNFANPEVILDKDNEMVIDDIDVLGFSYVDAPAYHGNSIYEVAIRVMQEGMINIRTGGNMEDEKMKMEAEKAKLVEEKAKLDIEKLAIEKQKEDMKKAEIDRQAQEQKKMQEELQAKSDALKKSEEEKTKLQAELNSVKGVVNQQTPPSQRQGTQPYDEKFFDVNIKEITKEHDETIQTIKKGQQPMIDNSLKGFGELVNLQAKISPTAGMSQSDVDFIRENRLLERGNADILARPK